MIKHIFSSWFLLENTHTIVENHKNSEGMKYFLRYLINLDQLFFSLVNRTVLTFIHQNVKFQYPRHRVTPLKRSDTIWLSIGGVDLMSGTWNLDNVTSSGQVSFFFIEVFLVNTSSYESYYFSREIKKGGESKKNNYERNSKDQTKVITRVR